ncbi:MAG: thiamine diphosphokinase [Acidobacteria bacterium]|nr:MAG: thiamine diphosphokinase [Acidobacteriota bacterium]
MPGQMKTTTGPRPEPMRSWVFALPSNRRKMKRRALLIANGELNQTDVQFGMDTCKRGLIIAADGGANQAIEAGIIPDVVIGDMDSIQPQTKELLAAKRWILKPSQEMGDLEKALLFCQEEGIEELTIIGFTGGRLDHALGNLSVLARYDRVFQYRLFSPHAELFFVRDTITLPSNPGTPVSLVPLDKAQGVTTKGLAYPLCSEPLSVGQREGTSNRATGTQFSISIASGLLLVFRGL